MRASIAIIALAVIPGAAGAQEMHREHGPGHAVSAVRPLYERVKNLYIRSAEQMPAEHYSFKPTESVRTFSEILGHVANENYLFCAAALGEKDPNTTDFEKVTAKADLVAGLKASFAYCDPAYRMPDERAMEEVTLFGNTGSRLWVLTFNVTHDSEHYGNIVTYMRMKGLVPPSSQQGM